MTYRRVVSCGLIAGLTKDEINRMRPGEVLDYYAYRRRYDQGNLQNVLSHMWED